MQLPWRLLCVPKDGRCALHATAVACGYKDAVSGNNVCNKIKSEIIQYYKNTHASTMIEDLFKTGGFMDDTKINDFGNSHIANPLYFKDFICQKSNWIKNVVACECENTYQIGLSKRGTCTHSKVVSFVHKSTKHSQTTQSVLKRNSVVFLNHASHWYVLMPYEKSIGL
tara:strand:- start:177 stop:683 length:507 start_codon:yes stop_codon:yes gene_type:complete